VPFSRVGKLGGLNNEYLTKQAALYRFDTQHAAAAVQLSLAHNAATYPPSYITHLLALT
jgi:hypothetical protein